MAERILLGVDLTDLPEAHLAPKTHSKSKVADPTATARPSTSRTKLASEQRSSGAASAAASTVTRANSGESLAARSEHWHSFSRATR